MIVYKEVFGAEQDGSLIIMVKIKMIFCFVFFVPVIVGCPCPDQKNFILSCSSFLSLLSII